MAGGMMDIEELLAELKKRGIRLELGEGNQVVARAPKGTLTPELAEAIRICKVALLPKLIPESEKDKVLALAERAGWPQLRIQRWLTVLAGEKAWRTAMKTTLPADMAAARVALEQLLQEAPDRREDR